MSHPNPHLAYRADIDGLRAVAVLAVVLFHAFPSWVPGGFIGVDIFFVISGYLISSILFKALAQGEFSFVDFYARRVRRIFPPLIVVVASASSWVGTSCCPMSMLSWASMHWLVSALSPISCSGRKRATSITLLS